jgi:hypothetical protein
MYNILGADPGQVGSSLAGNTGTGAPSTPPWLQQQNIPGVTGGVNNMVRALFGGLGQMQQANQFADAVKRAQQYANPGAPLDIQSDAQKQSMLTTPPPSFGTGTSSGEIY